MWANRPLRTRGRRSLLAHATASYGSGSGIPDNHSTLSLKVSGRKVSGYIEADGPAYIYQASPNPVCRSGKIRFSGSRVG